MHRVSSTVPIHDRVSVVLILIAFCMAVPPSAVWAATYYVDGDNPNARDAGRGTEARPWKTISGGTRHLQPGDTLLVKAGTYRETVILTQSGTAARPITIQAYPGHEGQAIINAAVPLTTWRQCTGPDDCSGNPNWSRIYWADVASLVAAHPDKTFAVRQVFQQGRLLPRSRFPNAGWRYPTTVADPKTAFRDGSLTQPEGYFAGAVCHIKTAVGHMDALSITGFSRGTITLTVEPRYNITPRFGYFITNVVGEINAEGEWAYDPAQKKIFVWPRGDAPEEIEFTYRERCLRTNEGVSFNIVRGLTMRYAYHCGILVYRSHNITIESNTVEYSFGYAIHLEADGASCDDNQVTRNTVKYSCSHGIIVAGEASRCTVEGNYVYATGVEHFGDDLLNGRGEGVFVWGPYARVCNNRIDRTGLSALYLGGQPIQREICFNHTTNTGLALSDGGSGLYTGGYHPGPEKDYIHHNIFADAIGCNTMNKDYEAGLPVTIEKYGGDSPGLYVDEEGNNRIIEHNTVIRSRLAGIYFHWAPTNLVRHNTLYGNGIAQLRLSGKNAERQALVEDVFLDNILFATDAQQKTLYLSMNYNDVHFGQSDRNWFYNPYADTHIHLLRYLTPSSGEHHDYLTLSGWQGLSGYDRNSKEFSYLNQLPQVTLASPVKSRIVYNASLDVNTIDLGPDLYCDVQGNGIRGKLVLQPFESKILIAAVDATLSDQATNPVPADGEQAGMGPVLEWTAAARAASHNVYLGTEKDAVSAADTASPFFRGRQGGTSFSLQGLVQPGTRYFWRVDEVEIDGTTIHKGVIWTFTSADYLVIDDFERYTDTEGGRIEETWSDGSLNGTGAQVSRASNLPVGWADDTHGKWSMSLAYDNAEPPHASEVERKFAPEQDWTAGVADTLSLWCRGDLVSFGETTRGSFVMSAAGTDIWGARDEFRFAYKQLSGNGSITMRVGSIGNTNVWAKAGPMIRESLETGSKNAYIAVTPGSGVSFQWRATASGASANSQTTGLVAPYWVRITRTGNNFKAERSADGKTWTQQGADAAILMTTNVYIGIAVTSHDASQTTMAEISNVSTTGNVTDQWQVADIGVDHPGNSPDDLYVTVEDSEGKTATVVNPDPAAVNTMAWKEWRIPLHNFNGVDLSRVRRMSIGVGSRAATTPKGDGRVCIDDIWVWKP